MTVSWRRSAWADGRRAPGRGFLLAPHRGRWRARQGLDRLEHDLARPQRQPELAQVGVGQLGQGLGRDLGVQERRRVALQPQIAQPSRNFEILPGHERSCILTCQRMPNFQAEVDMI